MSKRIDSILELETEFKKHKGKFEQLYLGIPDTDLPPWFKDVKVEYNLIIENPFINLNCLPEDLSCDLTLGSYLDFSTNMKILNLKGMPKNLRSLHIIYSCLTLEGLEHTVISKGFSMSCKFLKTFKFLPVLEKECKVQLECLTYEKLLIKKFKQEYPQYEDSEKSLTSLIDEHCKKPLGISLLEML